MNRNMALSLSRENKGLLPAIICGGVCVALMRTGLFTFFFLVPLGFCSVAFGSAAAWLGCIVAALANTVLSLGLSLYYGIGPASGGLDALYFAVLTFGFTWVMADNPPALRIPRIRTVYRMAGAAVAGALAFLGMAFALSREEGFLTVVYSQLEAVASSYLSLPGTDAARQTFLERVLTPDRIMDAFSMVAVRGGSLVSAFFLFFFSRQASVVIARLLRRYRRNSPGDLIGFYAPRRTIWALTLCLPAIVFFRIVSLESAEIIAWNVLVICAVIFLAQGGGIVLFTLARRPMLSVMRLFIGVIFVVLVFSPGVNLLVIGALLLLGIAENWLPLRKIGDQGQGTRDQ